ncbi:MAG: glycosyltransferase family 2 protein [Gemmatimonadota bacterium]
MGDEPLVISVVICTHNRSDSLDRALHSLSRVSVPDGTAWEIVVVDNASSDATRDVVERHVHTDLPVAYEFEERTGLSHARNTGVARSSGEIVAFLDDDVSVRADWLEELDRAFHERDASCVGGRALLRTDVPRPGWWRKEYDGKAGHFDRGDEELSSRSSEDGLVGIGANLAFRRDVFERHGLFRTELGRKGARLSTGEEVDLMNRVRRNGELALYWPDLVVYHHPHPSRFTKSYLRRWYEGYGAWDYDRRREDLREVPRILGIPRWKYRTAGRDLLRLLRGLVVGRSDEAFYAELRLRSFAGYVKAARRR